MYTANRLWELFIIAMHENDLCNGPVSGVSCDFNLNCNTSGTNLLLSIGNEEKVLFKTQSFISVMLTIVLQLLSSNNLPSLLMHFLWLLQKALHANRNKSQCFILFYFIIKLNVTVTKWLAKIELKLIYGNEKSVQGNWNCHVQNRWNS